MSDALTAAGVAPQEPQALDPEKVAETIKLAAPVWDLEYDDEYDYSEEAQRLARALCEAYTEGKLT